MHGDDQATILTPLSIRGDEKATILTPLSILSHAKSVECLEKRF